MLPPQHVVKEWRADGVDKDHEGRIPREEFVLCRAAVDAIVLKEVRLCSAVRLLKVVAL